MTSNVPTPSEFDALINDNEIVFVDFWAPWCAPCKQFSTIYKKVALRFPQIVFEKINIDEKKQLALDYGIRSIPHLLVFKDGMVVYSDAGGIGEEVLVDVVEKALRFDASDMVNPSST